MFAASVERLSLGVKANFYAVINWKKLYKVFGAHMAHSAGQDDGIIVGSVTNVSFVTPTTVKLQFHMDFGSNSPCAFAFKPGQWVDCFIPGVSQVGGYSMTSSPKELPFMELAVKRSQHPPAMAAHMAKVGDQWKFRVGGTFYLKGSGLYDIGTVNHAVKESGKVMTPVNNNILFVAGGVGINPLYSMLKHISILVSESRAKKSPLAEFYQHGKIVLLYSSRTKEELAFNAEILKISDHLRNFSYRPTLTQHQDVGGTGSELCSTGRIDEAKIHEALRMFEHNQPNPDCYICGPPAMADNVVSLLTAQSLPRENIFIEKWW